MTAIRGFFSNLLTKNSPADDFKGFWESVQKSHTALVTEQTDFDDAKALKASKIPDKLRRMLQLLLEEQVDPPDAVEDVNEFRSAGPCLEYLLNSRLVESLCMMGLADRPQGMMSIVLQTVYALVKHIKHPLLPHMFVHAPVCQLLFVCAELVKDFRLKTTEHTVNQKKIQLALVALIYAIWARIVEDPSQLNFFFQEGNQRQNPKLVIFTALLPYIHVRGRIGEYARSALITVVRLHKLPRLSDFVMHNTTFRQRLVEGVARAYKVLPMTLEAAEDATADAFQFFDNDRKKGAKPTTAVAAVQRFNERLWYCHTVLLNLERAEKESSLSDHVSSPSNKEKGQGLLSGLLHLLRKHFLHAIVKPTLLQTNQNSVAAATVYMRSMLELLGASQGSASLGPLPLLLIEFLIGNLDDETVEVEENRNCERETVDDDGPSTTSFSELALRRTLVRRVTGVATALSVVTMELFGAILDINDPRIVQRLAAHNLLHCPWIQRRSAPKAGSYRDATEKAADARAAASLAEEKENEKGDDEVKPQSMPSTPCTPDAIAAASLARLSSTPAAKFLSHFDGIPMPNDSSDQGFAAYMHDAQLQAVVRHAATESFEMDMPLDLFDEANDEEDHNYISSVASPTTTDVNIDTPKKKSEDVVEAASPQNNATSTSSQESVSKSTSDVGDSAGSPFFEGIFLRVFLDKLERFLDGTMEESLALTGVLSKLVQSPNEILYSFLFSTPGEGQCRNIEDAFATADADSDIDIDGNVGMQSHHEITERSLLTVLKDLWREASRRKMRIENFDNRLDATRDRLGVNPLMQGKNALVQADDFDVDIRSRKFIEAYVVLEEFIKEVSSAVQAREMLAAIRSKVLFVPTVG
eukprot:g3387.t1